MNRQPLVTTLDPTPEDTARREMIPRVLQYLAGLYSSIGKHEVYDYDLAMRCKIVPPGDGDALDRMTFVSSVLDDMLAQGGEIASTGYASQIREGYRPAFDITVRLGKVEAGTSWGRTSYAAEVHLSHSVDALDLIEFVDGGHRAAEQLEEHIRAYFRRHDKEAELDALFLRAREGEPVPAEQ